MRINLTRAQIVTILVCLLPLYALVAYDAYQRHQGPPTRGTGYVLTHDVPAGTQLGRGDVAGIPLTYSPSDFSYLTAPPIDAVVAKPLHGGTLLGPDDVLPATAALADLTIQATNPPPLSPGDLVDIYVATPVDYRRVGAHIPVVSASPLTIRVPAKDTAAWLALSNGRYTVLVSRTTDTASAGSSRIDACTALGRLSGEPCGAAGPGSAAPTPSPSATAAA